MWLYLVALPGLYFLFRWYWERKMVPNLTDKHVLITGCDTGFGNLLARQMDQSGLRVLATCLTQEGAEQLKETTSQRLQTFILDVTNQESVVAMAQWVKQQVGDKGLWGLVNKAGIAYPMAPSEWLTKEGYAKVLDVNLLSLIDVTLNLLPLVRQARGRIVNVSSGGGRVAFFGGGYSLSKFGVEAFSDTLRRELRPFGVKVAIIEPAAFKTNVATGMNIEQNLKAVWARVPKEVKESYGEQYFNTVCKIYIASSVKGNPNLHLATDCMQHAITAVYPRTRYSPGWRSKFFCIPMSYFPAIVQDHLLRRLYPKPSQ